MTEEDSCNQIEIFGGKIELNILLERDKTSIYGLRLYLYQNFEALSFQKHKNSEKVE